MRLQSVVFCERLEDTGPRGYNLYGVKGAVTVEMVGPKGAPRPALARLRGLLVVSLVEGMSGPFTLTVTTQHPDGPTAHDIPLAEQQWPDGLPEKVVMVNLQMDFDRGGVYRFDFRHEGRLLGHFFLPVTVKITRRS